uniref:Shieldin complex subunit 2 first OB fold domain-containing protein n=1 Tax=Spongospora subterranea TaxID=70186 RepID=A0A0H5RRW1_9EUKA|eukprot:CRZ11459.1 hypothetical protein [Spongospora subterranea]
MMAESVVSRNHDWNSFLAYQSLHLCEPINVVSIDALCPGTLSNLLAVVYRTSQELCSFSNRSTIVVTERSSKLLPISLWRNCSKWVQRIIEGDIILLTDIKISTFNGQWKGSTSFTSRMFKLPDPGPSSSLLSPRVRELSRLPITMRAISSDKSGLFLKPVKFGSLLEARTSTENGLYQGPATISVLHPSVSEPNLISLLVNSSSTSEDQYCDIVLLVDDDIVCKAGPNITRQLCADLCPSLVATTHSHIAYQLLSCLNAPHNQSFFVEISVIADIDANGMSCSREFLLTKLHL